MIGHWGSANSGSREAADIAEWVEAHYTPLIVERVVVYDLTQPPKKLIAGIQLGPTGNTSCASTMVP